MPITLIYFNHVLPITVLYSFFLNKVGDIDILISPIVIRHTEMSGFPATKVVVGSSRRRSCPACAVLGYSGDAGPTTCHDFCPNKIQLWHKIPLISTYNFIYEM